MTLQMAYLDRYREPVAMEIGPVLDLEDIAGGKVCALASRIEPRDYADTARMLERYGPAQLIGFARRLDPGLTARDYAGGGRQLDQIDDEAFARYGLDPRDVATLPERFAAWPRTARAAGKETRAGGHGNRQPQPGQAHAAPDREANQEKPGPAAVPQRRGGPDGCQSAWDGCRGSRVARWPALSCSGGTRPQSRPAAHGDCLR